MRTFKRHKTFEEVKALCKEQGLFINDALYLHRGYDTVVIKRFVASRDQVIYNTTNGRFYGTASVDGQTVQFHSDDKRDGAPWFDALLDFFYVEKDPVPASNGTLYPYQPTLEELGEDHA